MMLGVKISFFPVSLKERLDKECLLCGREFSEREGTLMAHTKLPEEKVIRLLRCQRWGICDGGTADICEVDIKTVHRFQDVRLCRSSFCCA